MAPEGGATDRMNQLRKDAASDPHGVPSPAPYGAPHRQHLLKGAVATVVLVAAA